MPFLLAEGPLSLDSGPSRFFPSETIHFFV
jgi:hypothetical protein